MKKRLFRLLALMLCGGFVFGNSNSGCARIAGDTTLTAVNACFIFDCQNGILGGLIDPCVPGQELFIDCFAQVP